MSDISNNTKNHTFFWLKSWCRSHLPTERQILIFTSSQGTGLPGKKNTDSLLSLIDDVDFKLDNFIRETGRNFKNVNNDLEDLSDEVRTNIRRTKQKLADLEQSRDQLSKDLKEVRALPSIIKGIQKMKEEAAKAAAEDD